MTCHLRLPSTPRELSHVHRADWFLPVVLGCGRAEAEGCCEFQASLSNREHPESVWVYLWMVYVKMCVCVWEGVLFHTVEKDTQVPALSPST